MSWAAVRPEQQRRGPHLLVGFPRDLLETTSGRPGEAGRVVCEPDGGLQPACEAAASSAEWG